MAQEGMYHELLQILAQAVQREVMAAKLYADTAAKTNNARAKELLEKLAKEEAHHRELLKAMYEEIAGEALYVNEE
jgi:rubrerythrin